MSLLRSRAALPLAVVAVLASACTGTTPTAGHSPEHSGTPAAAQPSVATTPASETAPAPSSSPSDSATPETAQACPTASLHVSVRPAGVAAGSTYQQLVFTNTGDAPCTLTGFPGVSLVEHPDGAPVGAAADRTGGTSTVSLAPGGSARARLQITDAQNYSEDGCRQTPTSGLQVYPPNQSESVFVPDNLLACAHSSVHILNVQSVRAAS